MNNLHYRVLNRNRTTYKLKKASYSDGFEDSDGLVYRSELCRRLNIPASRIQAYLKFDLLPFKASDGDGKGRRSRYKYDVDEVKKRLRLIDRLQRRGNRLVDIQTYLKERV